jgi:guanylate kinase
VVDGLAARIPFTFSVSMTTRAARSGEVDGVDYHFVDRAAFERAIAAGDLVEWAEYGGNLYGTPAAALEQARAGGDDVLLDIEIVGSRLVRERFSDAILIWIEAPSIQDLERRLRRRGDTSDADIQRRLGVAEAQMREARGLFDHFVVNEDLSLAIDRLVDILAHVPEHPLDPS